jgi:beta-mannosidase
VDLSGEWRALVANDELRRSGIGPDVDDSSWEPITVPGHWRSTPAFADNDDPILFRRPVDVEAAGPGQRQWLILDGIFYQADVWFDGVYLGDPEGYFFPHAFDITSITRLGSEHALAVEVACSPQRDKRAKRNLTGVFQHWDGLDPQWNPGGIWRPVRIVTTGPVRIDRLRVLCRDANSDRANVLLHARLDSDVPRQVRIRTTVGGYKQRDRVQALATGSNEVEWTLGINNPRLWWPWSLGLQEMTDVTVEVFIEGEETPSDTATRRTGIRQIAFDQWQLSVNGERLFLKGANHGPTRMQIAEAEPEDFRRDVELAKDAGLDLLRVHAHITRPEFYEAADELGMLVWQDLPLQWGYARSVRRQAVQQAREAVDLLGHHPSVAVWCGHNEPFTLDMEPGRPISMPSLAARYLAGQQLPSWNRSVLDRWIKRSLERNDDSRPVIAHSGVLPHLPLLDGTDSHLYFGWYHGNERDLPRFAASLPSMVRFVSEFGAQAVPDSDDFIEPERWPVLDWDRLGRRHCLQKDIFDKRVPPGDYSTFDAWRLATQNYQAILLKHHIETLRRLKYRPTGGFCLFSFADGNPAISWSILDHERRPKRAFAAVADACRPVIVVADRLPATLAPGDSVALDVHVVNDLRIPLDGAIVTARASWPGGESMHRFMGDVLADACARVGTLRFDVPDVRGLLTVDLTLEHDAATVSNRYDALVGAG